MKPSELQNKKLFTSSVNVCLKKVQQYLNDWHKTGERQGTSCYINVGYESIYKEKILCEYTTGQSLVMHFIKI